MSRDSNVAYSYLLVSTVFSFPDKLLKVELLLDCEEHNGTSAPCVLSQCSAKQSVSYQVPTSILVDISEARKSDMNT